MSTTNTTNKSNGAATRRWAICKSVSNNDKYRLIIPYTGVELTEKQFKDIRRGVRNFQHRERDNGRCGCPYDKTYICTMDCCSCQYQNGTEYLLYVRPNDDEAPKKKSPFVDNNDKLIKKEQEEERKAKGKKPLKVLDASNLCVRAPLSPVEYAEEADDIENIITAVSAMGPEEEQILHMLFEGYKPKEIMEILDIPHSTYYKKRIRIQDVVSKAIAINICA